MARASPTYVCGSCGGETLKWQGQCPLCGEWNSLEQRTAASARPAPAAKPVALSSGVAAMPAAARIATGTQELDRVLGGGIVPGSVILLGGDPGIGKSTLLLQVAAAVAHSRAVLYASAEESVSQVSGRAERLSLGTAGVAVAAETDLAASRALAAERRVELLVIDSIQTMQSSTAGAPAGAVSQLRECTAELVRFAKASGTAVIIVGHVTKEGTIAGPRLLEHLVDTVLYFEHEAGSRYRIVRATKNRFGAVNELGFFAMTAGGLREVKNPAAIFLARPSEPAPGRIAQGLDANRLAMLLAAGNRHAGVSLQEHDVFVNVVGGIEIGETSADLPVLIALTSSLRGQPLPAQLVAFGEIGLTGEVRPVAYGDERLREAQAQGFRLAIVPQANAPRTPPSGMRVIAVTRIAEALEAALSRAA